MKLNQHDLGAMKLNQHDLGAMKLNHDLDIMKIYLQTENEVAFERYSLNSRRGMEG